MARKVKVKLIKKGDKAPKGATKVMLKFKRKRNVRRRRGKFV